MNNVEYFENQIKYWSKRLRLGEIDIISNVKMEYVVFVDEYQEDKTLWYNPYLIQNMAKYLITFTVFHELGHFKHPIFRDSDKYKDWELLLCEYMAEKQALIWLKKYYPRYYRVILRNIPEDIEKFLGYPKKYSYYFEAFSQIPEYAKHL